MNNVIDFINTNRDRYVDELKSYLAIPSISALPAHAGDVRKCAEWTCAEMERIGLQNVRLVETPGHPVVYGDWLGAEGAPTILFYGHYDVQPVDPLDLWETPPFEPRLATLPDGRQAVTARGAVDDKGQVMTFLEACRAWIAMAGELPVGVTVMVEGEEEIGSRNLPAFVEASQDELRADLALVCDTGMWD